MEIIFTMREQASYDLFKKQFEVLLLMGVDTFRINFGKPRNKAKQFQLCSDIKKITSEYPCIKIMLDFPYPRAKPRIDMNAKSFNVTMSNKYIIRGKDNKYVNRIPHEEIILDTLNVNQAPGNCLYYGDGECAFDIIETYADCILVKALTSYNLCNGKPIAGCSYEQPASCLRDYATIIDYINPELVAFSFISSREDIDSITSQIRTTRPIGFISKIESAEAIVNIPEIIEASDGVMVARGDLGMSVNIARIGVLQEYIMQVSKQKKKIVYVATGILSSLVHNVTPARADITDITCLIQNKVDGVILNNDIVYYNKADMAIGIIKNVLHYCGINNKAAREVE